MRPIVQVRRLATAAAFVEHADAVGADLPFEAEVEREGPLSHPVRGMRNRFAILPMEGWDATGDGRPTELVLRRWRRFGSSGAALVWGGEAVAVREEGRANPNQLLIGDHVADLRGALEAAHERAFGTTAGLVVGLQLTHSGRFARSRPAGAHDHPYLRERFPAPVLTDAQLDDLVGAFADAASVAARAGFSFVDLKACHGYLGHELLSAVDRGGRYGGSLENRSRFLLDTVRAVARTAPGLGVGVRLSAFDVAPHTAGPDGVGAPVAGASYRYAFGGDGTGTGTDLSEPVRVARDLVDLGAEFVCVTAGSPYYSPHVQRPAYFPPSDGYLPPEDPLVGVSRLVAAAAAIKRAVPGALVVGSGYSYLQEWLPHVAQAVVRRGMADVVGIGRMALSYPDLPADVLAGRPLDRRRLCRTFSDCTTAPRNGLVSGCWPLDDFYKSRPERHVLAAAKREARSGPGESEP